MTRLALALLLAIAAFYALCISQSHAAEIGCAALHGAYSCNDGRLLCLRHQTVGPVTREGWTAQGVTWEPGFEYCLDLMQWWADAQPYAVPSPEQDKRILDEMQRAMGPFPQPQHVK